MRIFFFKALQYNDSMQIHLKLSIILVCILLLLDRLIKKVSQNDIFTLQKMYFHYFLNNKETIKSHQYGNLRFVGRICPHINCFNK